MSQTDSEQQLRIWKDLAISKQVLMNEAASALKLKSDFTPDELREALDANVRVSRDADKNMQDTRREAEQKVAEMREEVRKAEKARTQAEAERDAARTATEQAANALSTGRKDNAEALKKAKRQVEDKQKELKAINTALADTPDNIVKKLKALKKQKLDEANARKVAEDANRKLRKETKTQQEELGNLRPLVADSSELLSAYRALRTAAEAGQEQLKSAGIEAESLPDVDDELLDRVDTATASKDEEETDTRAMATA